MFLRWAGITMTTLFELTAGVVVKGEHAPFNFRGWLKLTYSDGVTVSGCLINAYFFFRPNYKSSFT